MDLIVLIARLLLAAVFVVAALTKLTDRDGTRRAVVGFGVPERLAPPLAAALPISELAIAALLIPTATAWWGALGALALLALFVAGIAVNMARGRTPDCHCFGQLYSEPIGWSTLGRNAVLVAIAAAIIVRGQDSPGASAVAWLGNLTVTQALTLIAGALIVAAVAGLAWLSLHLMQQNGRLLARLERLEAIISPGVDLPPAPPSRPAPFIGLPIGTPAPTFELPVVGGGTASLASLRAAGLPVMLLFSDPHCGPCNALLPDVSRWQAQHRADLTIALVSRGSNDENAAKIAQHGLGTVLLQADREVSEAYRAYGTPAAVIVTPDSTVASAVSGGADAIRRLLSGWVKRSQPVPPPANGQPTHRPQNGGQPQRLLPMAVGLGQQAPELTLRDLDGNSVDSSIFRGERTLALFWNPGCGFCQRMLPELQAWEAKPAPDSPRLLFISTGPAETNRAMNLRSTILLDDAFAAGRAFGANGTPSAVLLDEKGRVASRVAVGAPDVMALASQHPATAPTS